VAGYDYFFLPPTSGYHIMHTQYFFTLFVMLLVAQVISHLAIVKRRQLESSYQVQHQTTALYALSRQLASIRGIDKLLETGTRYLEENTDSVVLALVPKQNQLEIRGDHRGNQIIDVKEQGIAKWVYEMGQIAGFGTDTLSFSTALYIPLLASIGPVGVLRIQPNQQQPFTHEQLQFIDICANQIALALEVDRLEDRVRKDEIQAAIDRVRKTMLQSVSYVQKQYLKSQDVRLHMKPSSIKEVISRATQASSKRLESFRFVVKSLDSCPEANLIDSALKFTHSELPVEIDAKASDHTLIVSVERDILIAEEANKFLEKFHHKNMLSSEGELDLVLVLTQSIIEAHHGKVWFEQVNEGRVAFRFTLPLAQMDHH